MVCSASFSSVFPGVYPVPGVYPARGSFPVSFRKSRSVFSLGSLDGSSRRSPFYPAAPRWAT